MIFKIDIHSSTFKAMLLSVLLGGLTCIVDFLYHIHAEFRIEQARQTEFSDLNFERIVELAKSSNGQSAQLEKFATTSSILRPSLVELDISLNDELLVDWERPRQPSTNFALDRLTERWIIYERLDAETGLYLRGVKDSHIAYRFFMQRVWMNARTTLLHMLLIIIVVSVCTYLLLVRPLQIVRGQFNSPKFLERGLRVGPEAGTEFSELALAVNEVVARDQQLRRRNKRLYLALMNTHDACVIYTASDGRAIFLNHEALEILGGEREEWIGTPIYEMSASTNIDTYRQSQQQLSRDGTIRQVRKIISQEGSTRFVEVTTNQTMIDDEKINIMMVRDLQQPEKAIKQSQVNDLRRMIGGIAHELNNNHLVIKGRVDLAMEELPVGHSSRSMLQQVSTRVDQVNGMINRLMTYAQIAQTNTVNFNVEEAISFVVNEQRSLAKQHDIEMSSTEDARKTEILMDKEAFFTILRELIKNAVEASAPGTLLLISLDEEILNEKQLVSNHALAAGSYIKIVVSDQGRGMTPREIAAAFDPFYSVSSDPSRGMGLSSVQSSVEMAGGAIDIESAPGVGTNVTVLLPVAEEPIRVAPVPDDTFSI